MSGDHDTQSEGTFLRHFDGPRIFAILGILAGLILVEACGRQLPSQPACGFVQNSELQRVSWKTDVPVTMYLDGSVPYDYVQSVQSAMDVWNKVSQNAVKKDFFKLGTGNPGTGSPSVDGYSKIYLLNSWETDRSNEQARTTIYWTGARIYEADMRLNAFNFQFYTNNTQADFSKVNLQSLIVHELGHVLGMAHDQALGSVMQPSLANGLLRITPASVDVQALNCEY